MEITLLSLATWRITRMLLAEDGPGNVLGKLRQWVFSGLEPGSQAVPGSLPYLFTCPYCMSIWWAGLLSMLLAMSISQWLLLTLSASAGSILIHTLMEAHQNHWSLSRAKIDLYRVQVDRLPVPEGQEETQES